MNPRLGWPGPLGPERSIAQELDARVVGRITLRPGLQRVAVKVETTLPERRHDALELLAGRIVAHGFAIPLDLVCAMAVEAGRSKQPIRGDPDVVTDTWNRVDEGALVGFVWGLVFGEPHVPIGPEHRCRPEIWGELPQQSKHRGPDVFLVGGLMRRPVSLGVVGLEPLVEDECLVREAAEAAVRVFSARRVHCGRVRGRLTGWLAGLRRSAMEEVLDLGKGRAEVNVPPLSGGHEARMLIKTPRRTVLFEHPQRDRIAVGISQSAEGFVEQLVSDATTPVRRVDIDGPDLARRRSEVAIGAGHNEADKDLVEQRDKAVHLAPAP